MLVTPFRPGDYSLLGGIGSLAATSGNASSAPHFLYASASPQVINAALGGMRVEVPLDVWLKTMRFEGFSQLQTLDMVLDGVKRAMQQYKLYGGQKPVVVFDLDDTLFRSNQTRT